MVRFTQDFRAAYIDFLASFNMLEVNGGHIVPDRLRNEAIATDFDIDATCGRKFQAHIHVPIKEHGSRVGETVNEPEDSDEGSQYTNRTHFSDLQGRICALRARTNIGIVDFLFQFTQRQDCGQIFFFSKFINQFDMCAAIKIVEI